MVINFNSLGDFQPLEASSKNLPNISFDTSAEMNTDEMYSPGNFNPIHKTMGSIPAEAVSPTTSNSSIEIASSGESPRIIHGDPNRFKSAEKEKVKSFFHTRKRNTKPDGFDAADTN